MEIRKHDSEGPYFTPREDNDHQRTLTISLFRPEPAAVNIVIDVIGPDGHSAGAGINVSPEELGDPGVVEANRYDHDGQVRS